MHGNGIPSQIIQLFCIFSMLNATLFSVHLFANFLCTFMRYANLAIRPFSITQLSISYITSIYHIWYHITYIISQSFSHWFSNFRDFQSVSFKDQTSFFITNKQCRSMEDCNAYKMCLVRNGTKEYTAFGLVISRKSGDCGWNLANVATGSEMFST